MAKIKKLEKDNMVIRLTPEARKLFEELRLDTGFSFGVLAEIMIKEYHKRYFKVTSNGQVR